MKLNSNFMIISTIVILFFGIVVISNNQRYSIYDNEVYTRISNITVENNPYYGNTSRFAFHISIEFWNPNYDSIRVGYATTCIFEVISTSYIENNSIGFSFRPPFCGDRVTVEYIVPGISSTPFCCLEVGSVNFSGMSVLPNGEYRFIPEIGQFGINNSYGATLIVTDNTTIIEFEIFPSEWPSELGNKNSNPLLSFLLSPQLLLLVLVSIISLLLLRTYS